MSEGLSREEAREKIFAKVAPSVFEKVLDELKASKALIGSERLALPTHKATVAGADDRIRTAILDAFRSGGLKPPDAAGLEAAVKAPAPVIEKVVALLLREKLLTRLDTIVFHAEALQQLKREVSALKGSAPGEPGHGGRGGVQGALRNFQEVCDPVAGISRPGARHETNRRRPPRFMRPVLLVVLAVAHRALEVLDARPDTLAELG